MLRQFPLRKSILNFFRFYAHNIEQENRNKIIKYKCTVTNVATINTTTSNTAVHIKLIMIFNSFV